jgi:hypothetical protein
LSRKIRRTSLVCELVGSHPGVARGDVGEERLLQHERCLGVGALDRHVDRYIDHAVGIAGPG